MENQTSFFDNFLGQILGRQMDMIKQLLRQIFSEKCQLQYLQLDISKEYRCGSLHKCLLTNSSLSSNSIQTHSVTLRHLDIRLNSTYFLENLIERVPSLEQLSVEFLFSLIFDLPSEWDIEASENSNDNWLNKVRRKIPFLTFHLIVLHSISFLLYSSQNCNVLL